MPAVTPFGDPARVAVAFGDDEITLLPGNGSDSLDTGDGDDHVRGAEWADSIEGGSGQDTLEASLAGRYGAYSGTLTSL